FLSSKKHPLGEKRNHPGSKLRQGFWMVFRFGVNNWGLNFLTYLFSNRYKIITLLAVVIKSFIQSLSSRIE
ncbi:hypothetical protein, partial [Streptococcus pneumoniae]|uniref:hypothetical protein n=1 Tax=Streptococcus pneumoniae TaxID=1313 RepID=UPI001C72964F